MRAQCSTGAPCLDTFVVDSDLCLCDLLSVIAGPHLYMRCSAAQVTEHMRNRMMAISRLMRVNFSRFVDRLV